MSSIAIYYSTFSEEKEIREQLVASSGFDVVQDDDIIDEVCQRYKMDHDKVKRALYGPTSVFNKFTLERERITALFKASMAEHLKIPEVVYCGNLSLLIPPEVTHVLKVGLFDEKGERVQRAVTEGLSEKSALKLIKKNDASATDWTDFLLKKEIGDSSLYDIVIPLGSRKPEYAVQLIMENYHKPAVLESEESRQAIDDMALAAQVELALIDKGYTPEVKSSKGEITLLVNKSVLNFSKFSDTLTEIVKGINGVQGVEVATGKDYLVSIYRGQEFTLPPKVLLVDDEQEFVQTLSERLNTRNYGSYPVFDGEQALDFLGSETPDVMVLDLKMPGVEGVEVLRKTKESNPEIEIIILTGHGSEEDKKICMGLGAYAYLNKPVDIVQLTEIIDKAYEKVAVARINA